MKVKRILDFNIPYWRGKRINIILSIHENEISKRLLLVFWLNYKLKEIEGYEDDWGLGKRKTFTLWTFKSN